MGNVKINISKDSIDFTLSLDGVVSIENFEGGVLISVDILSSNLLQLMRLDRIFNDFTYIINKQNVEVIVCNSIITDLKVL
jgi:hypothetical protein